MIAHRPTLYGLTPSPFRNQFSLGGKSKERSMTREFSSLSRFVGAATAAGLLTASLATPASAMPLSGAGFGAVDRDVSPVQWQQQQHPHQGSAGGMRPAPGWRPGPGHGPASGGQWAHRGGHWHNGAWIPFAVGFGILGAAAAAAAYGAPPAPGMCWYYDDPYQTTGHWDYC